MSPNFILLFAVSIGLIAISKCYPTGAPQETCKLFNANHTGISPQNSKSKYVISINPSNVNSGGMATVTIRGDTFKGFFIQAEDSEKKRVGQFKSQSGVSQTRDCNGPRSATASTHVDANDKTVVNLEWKAPPSYKGPVVFRAVIVKTFETFWNNVESKRVQIS